MGPYVRQHREDKDLKELDGTMMGPILVAPTSQNATKIEKDL